MRKYLITPFADYVTLLRQHGRFIGFGFFMTWVSGAGQTYFIGVFGPSIQQQFSLSHTEWGSLYMLGTLASAALLPWTGQWVDHAALRIYSLMVLIGLVIACLNISLATNALWLVLAIFLLRQFGQGLSSHTSQTSMARYIGAHRGKALALASMGFSAGEAILPVLAVLSIAAFGWQRSYQFTALGVLLFIPLILWTLKGHQQRHQQFLDQQAADDQNENTKQNSSTRRQMLRERRFYLILPAILMPSYTATALFFYHLTLADAKGWSQLWMTGNYWLYALVTVLTSLLAGPFIDRFTATRTLPYFLLPLIAALLMLVPAKHPLWLLPYMVLLGINIGLYFTATAALWAELYGARHLGSIKSAVNALNVFASALGPVSVGTLLDAQWRIEQVLLLFAALCALATWLLIIGLKHYRE